MTGAYAFQHNQASYSIDSDTVVIERYHSEVTDVDDSGDGEKFISTALISVCVVVSSILLVAVIFGISMIVVTIVSFLCFCYRFFYGMKHCCRSVTQQRMQLLGVQKLSLWSLFTKLYITTLPNLNIVCISPWLNLIVVYGQTWQDVFIWTQEYKKGYEYIESIHLP